MSLSGPFLPPNPLYPRPCGGAGAERLKKQIPAINSFPLPPDEADRLKALGEYAILDTLPESCYDDITTLAAQICGTPISLVSLLDGRRQWFKSKVGLDVSETARELAFCAHAIMRDELLVVPDARNDERFANNPLVTADPHIRFYAGAPLVTLSGHALGTLCVIDRAPRVLTEAQSASLLALSRQVMAQLELRRHVRELEKALSEIKTLSGLLPICCCCKKIRDDKGYWSQVEQYISERTSAEFSHGYCPECFDKQMAIVDAFD